MDILQGAHWHVLDGAHRTLLWQVSFGSFEDFFFCVCVCFFGLVLGNARGSLQLSAYFAVCTGSQKGGFQKGGSGGRSPAPTSGTKAHSDVPRYQKTERRYIRMFPSAKSRNEGYIRQSRPFTKPPFCLFPLELKHLAK